MSWYMLSSAVRPNRSASSPFLASSDKFSCHPSSFDTVALNQESVCEADDVVIRRREGTRVGVTHE